MSTEAKVAGHYTRGRLEESILQGVKRAGKTPENLVMRISWDWTNFTSAALKRRESWLRK